MEIKDLAERVQITGKKFMSSYQVRDDILTCEGKSSNNSYTADGVLGSYMRAIGIWILVILALVSFFVGIVSEHDFIGCFVGLFFVFLGIAAFGK